MEPSHKKRRHVKMGRKADSSSPSPGVIFAGDIMMEEGEIEQNAPMIINRSPRRKPSAVEESAHAIAVNPPPTQGFHITP